MKTAAIIDHTQARAWYLDSNSAASLLCFAEHGGQQGGLSAAYMSHHSNEGTSWYMDVDPVNKGGESPVSLSLFLSWSFQFDEFLYSTGIPTF